MNCGEVVGIVFDWRACCIVDIGVSYGNFLGFVDDWVIYGVGMVLELSDGVIVVCVDCDVLVVFVVGLLSRYSSLESLFGSC